MTRVLVIRHSEEAARILSDCLRGRYQVRASAPFQSAIEQLHEFQPEVVLLDLFMPSESCATIHQIIDACLVLGFSEVFARCFARGLQCLSVIRRDNPDVPVVLFTGWSDLDNTHILARAECLVVRTEDPEELSQAISAYMSRRVQGTKQAA